MRASPWLISTLKESPAEAETISHKLMLRAGFIRPLASGLYTWMPLGLKVLRKIEAVIREELNQVGALELLMPAIQPAELWQETERWDTFGGQLLKLKDNNDRAYCFGPTHEEVITDLMRKELQSYKQLPVNVYQIQTKFRDEIRPRFGVMRAREFLMKDAYSFHLDDSCLQNTYDTMYQAYCRIFDRLGYKYRAVEADSGAIGGAVSHEFQVLADAGEDKIVYSDGSDYAANIEQATSTPAQSSDTSLQVLFVEGEEVPEVALVLCGEDTLNEVRAEKHPLVKAPLTFKQGPTPCPEPNKLDMPMVVDHLACSHHTSLCEPNDTYDLREVKAGDTSPDGKGTLHICRGIEVGHIFQLGPKYADIMDAKVLNKEGKAQTLTMGCYGLGISRMVAAAIEQHHDEKGMCLPAALAPFELAIIPINMHRNEDVKQAATELYQACLAAGIDVLLDDRNERPGVLFADNDLIGTPHRVVIGDKGLKQGTVEFKARNQADSEDIALEAVIKRLQSLN